MINAVMIDSREPEWVQRLKFGGAPTAVTMLDTGDVQAVTDEGHILLVERKTPDDLLNTLRENRLFPQAAHLAHARIDQQLAGQPVTIWPYLVITGQLMCSPDGKVITEHRETAWSYSSLQGALLSIQEMGVFVIQCAGDGDFEDCIMRLGGRSRAQFQPVLPPRPAVNLGPGFALIASLPGIGIERTQEVMAWAGNTPGVALVGLTDLTIPGPVGPAVRKKVRQVLGLKENETLELFAHEPTQ